jgi:TP901 family phage tail tape measure protein
VPATKVDIIFKGIDQTGSVLKKMQGSFAAFAKKATATVGAVGGGVAVLVKNANDFSKSMAEISTIAGGADINQLTKDVIDLSAELGKTKAELSEGLYQTLSAGIPANNAVDFLRTATQGAIAGVADTASSVEALTRVLTAYRLDADQAAAVSDKMFTAVKNGQVTFDQIAGKIGVVAGVAADAGVSMDELFGVIAQSSKTIKAEQLFTALRQAVLGVVAPSTELSKVYEELGTTGQELIGEKGLAGALQLIGERAGGSIDKLKELLPSTEALPIVLSLVGENADAAADSIDQMAGSMNATAQAFEKMDAVRGWDKLWQNILRPITEVGMIFDKELLPFAEKFGVILNKWQESEAFADMLTNIKGTLSGMLEVAEQLFGSDAGGRSAAFEKIMAAGSDFAARIVDVLLDQAIPIGVEIGKGIATGIAEAFSRHGQEQADRLAEARERGDINVLERAFPFLSNLISGGAFEERLRTAEALSNVNEDVSVKMPPAVVQALNEIARNTNKTARNLDNLQFQEI